jgi:selenocysteine-specific elongation factor
MQVIATAGHVDHGKSALLKALTGMEPDRWEEERRRGLTIDLGFVWTSDSSLAFVDVPGHERFVGNMLAGVGSVPAVLFVVAADEGWMPQSAEHLAALDALQVRHGILAISKADVMEPDLAAEEALAHLARTSLGRPRWFPVSARTGQGIAELRQALDQLAARIPRPDPLAPVRLWVDRAFTIHGSGLVVTGTLSAGTIRAGDTLELDRGGKRFTVREIQSLGRKVGEATGAARVALNLRGARRGDLDRGDALLTPDSYRCTSIADVRTKLCAPQDLPPKVLLHIGASTVECRVRPLDEQTARISLSQPLPLRVGDRVVLRTDRGVAGGAVVLDPDPPALRRRGAARERALALEGYEDQPDAKAELRRRGIVRADLLHRMGFEAPGLPVSGDWLVDPALAGDLRERLGALSVPVKAEDARKALKLPDVRLVAALLPPQLAVRDGVIVAAGAQDTLTDAVRDALQRVEARHKGFETVGDADLAALSPAGVAAAIRSGRMVRLAPDVVLLSAAVDHAVEALRGLPQPFTVSQAREALGSTRKVMVPLLEHLARVGKTRRTADGHHAIL